MNHAGMIRDIIYTSELIETIYPGLHLLSASVVLVTGVSSSMALAIAASLVIILLAVVNCQT